jgi:uncharacterized SAM-binding protein YcdF (DUF218 family)
LKYIKTSARVFLIIMGALFALAIGLAFTSAPFWLWYHLGKKQAGINRPPDYIVVLGGGGMPSESGLIRCWYTARAAEHFNRAKVLVALPGDTADSASSVIGMKNELILRGIASKRILLEFSGTNTRSQALNIRQILSSANASSALLLISSPEHIQRAVLTFRKAGFSRVDGQPAWERTIESDLEFKGRKLGGRRFIPEIGDNLAVRYNFWTQLNYEILVMREWSALAYYYFKDWI